MFYHLNPWSKKWGPLHFVLGAGFSKPAGLPLGLELWPEIRARARGLEGRAGHFESDLKKYVEFRRACDNIDLDVEDVDFEEFMAFLDLEHFLGLRGSDTWSDDGNESQVVVKTLIAQILTERTPAKDQLPQIYYDFATALEPTDYVLTFNSTSFLSEHKKSVSRFGSFRIDTRRFARPTQLSTTRRKKWSF